MMKHLPKLLSVILLLSLLTGCDNSRPATTVPETTTAPTTTAPETTVAPTTAPITTAAPTTEPLNIYCDLPEFTPATDPTTLPADPILSDLVTTGYTGSACWEDLSGNIEAPSFCLPSVTPFSADAIAINWEIAEIFNPTLEQTRGYFNEKVSAWELETSYEASLSGDVLSILITTVTQTDYHRYHTFLLDISTGSRLSEPNPAPLDTDFVRISDYLPDIFIDLRYATEDNFTGQAIYDFRDAYLRYGTVKKLIAVQNELRSQGLILKIWDAFRPTDAQFRLWEICPDPNYVADPTKGFSDHSRGNTLDITLCYADGTELKMPTGFDDFSALADRDYSDCTPEAAANAKLLESIMTKHGFTGYSGEWWHYSDTDSYDVDETFTPV